MGREYYYFCASLPMLAFNQDPPCSVEDFVLEAERQLDKSDVACLRSALEDRVTPGSKAACRWADIRHQFKNEFASVRAVHAGKDPFRYMRGEKPHDPYIIDTVVEASKLSDPLEAERLIDHRTWEMLDDLEAGHLFDMDRIVVHGLKLQILERHQTFRSDKGKENFDGILKNERLSEAFATVRH